MQPLLSVSLACMALLTAAPGFAQPAPIARGRVELGPSASFLLDPGGTMTAMEAAAADRWQPFNSARRSFGITSDALWLRAELRATGSGRFFLTFEAPLVEELDVFVEGATLHEHRRGGLEARGLGEIVPRAGGWTTPLDLEEGQVARVLVRARSRRSLFAGLALTDPVTLAQDEGLLWAWLAAQLGVFVVMLTISLWRFGVRRDRRSLRFAFVFVCYALYEASVSGFAAAHLWPSWPRWGSASATVFAAATIGFLVAYSRAFTDTKRDHPRLERAGRALQWATLVTGLAALVVFGIPEMVNGVLAIACFGFVLAAGAAAVARGDASARYFLYAFSVIALFAVAVVLVNLGMSDPGFASRHGLDVAAWVGAIVFMLGLEDRYERSDRRAKEGLEQTVASTSSDLAQTQERFRLAFNTTPDAMAILRMSDGHFVAVNQGLERITHWSVGESIGKSSQQLGLWAIPAQRHELWRRACAGERVENMEVRLRRKDGNEFDALLSCDVAQLGGEAHMFGVVRDIHTWRRAERERDDLRDQLRQSQKMEAIGRLAGGIAHDFNNLLTVILTGVELARMNLQPANVERSLQEIADAGNRAAQLTRQLLVFGRRQVMEPQPTDLNALVDGMRSMLHRLLGEDVALTVEPARDKALVVVDRGQIEQVVMNLVLNARDAFDRPGGRIGISIRTLLPAPGRPDGAVELTVRDNGSGIAADVRERIFEPFFTTKPAGVGTGLGLSMVDGIVSQHGGSVRVDSTPGQGSAFHVCLPLARDVRVVEEPPRLAEPLQPRHGTVLLTEDEASVRSVTARMLEQFGYRVLVAADAEEALRIFAAHRDEIDVLVTDVILPRANGRLLAGQVRALRPGVAVVYLSGYPRDVLSRDGILDPETLLVRKPFSSRQLAEAIGEARGRARGGS